MQAGVVDEQKCELDIEKQSGGVIITNTVKGKCKLWRDWKQENTSKKKYLEDKKKPKRNDQKWNVLKIAKKMAKTNQGIIGENCMRNDNGMLAVSDEDRKIAWKSYLEKFLNTKFAMDRIVCHGQIELAMHLA